jgi:hypothetical protein
MLIASRRFGHDSRSLTHRYIMQSDCLGKCFVSGGNVYHLGPLPSHEEPLRTNGCETPVPFLFDHAAYLSRH